MLNRQAEVSNRMGVLIDDLLQLSRISRQAMVMEPVDLSALAREVATEIGPSAARIEIEEGLEATGDRRLLRFVYQNLLQNAVKFSPGGGVVRVGRLSDGAFFVADEGIGFDMRFANKLFEPFQRLVHDSEFPGTGIGLANVQRIVQRHGGRVWAESEPGRGATFYFTL
jgi:signal transduction histidine kinase